MAWIGRAVAVLVLLLSGLAVAHAEPLDVVKAFQPAEIDAMRLSPDGRHLLAMANRNGWTAIVLMDTASLTSRVIDKPTRGRDAPWSIDWVTDSVFAVRDSKGTRFSDLTGQTVFASNDYYRFFLHVNERNEEIVLVKRDDHKYFYDRLNLRTGKTELTNFHIPDTPVQWLFDDRGVARVVTTISTAFWGDDTTVAHWYRDKEEDSWRRLATFPYLDTRWFPHRLSKDGRSLVVSSHSGRETRAYFRYDIAAGAIKEMLAGHPAEDVTALVRDDNDFPVVMTHGLIPRMHWFDDDWDRLQKAVDKALPDRVNFLSGHPARQVLVRSYGDVDTGRYLLLDTTTMKMREIGVRHPELDPAKLRPMRTVSYPSLDGLSIPAYLTLPAGEAHKVPAVVLIHGGPVARDRWGYDAEVQLLASRGYAVLQPQFRGSAGFGKRFEEMGYGQWGLAMQDDVTAGAQWLVAQGIADPARMCIMGASYGGYAALFALVKTPTLFRCGVSFAGVSDLNYMFKDDSDTNDSPIGRLVLRAWVGDPRSKAQQFAAVSPLERAQEIRAPLLIAHGTRDGRVPIEHSEKMVAALRKYQKSLEWLPLKDQGHGFSTDEARKSYYDAVFAFLDKHIGQPAAAEPAAPLSARASAPAPAASAAH